MKRTSALNGLTVQQRAAAKAGPEGPILVNAGPGSGKTKVLTARIAWLVKERGVPPGRILAMTFSVKAAEEMRHRIRLENLGKEIWIGTFHKVCRKILTEANAQELSPWKPSIRFIMNDAGRLDFIEAAMRESDPHRNQFPRHGKKILEGISLAKNWLIPPQFYSERAANAFDVEPDIARLVAVYYASYQSRMQSINTMDFDDQLMQTALLLQQKASLRERIGRQFEYVLVDEFQDLSHVQYCLVRLFGWGDNIFVVGDEDQTIYGWRGADTRNFENFRRDCPHLREFILRQNFRSKKTVLEPSQHLVRNNSHRLEKELFTRRGDGPPLHVQKTGDEDAEANYVAEKIRERGKREEWSDYAVLYRNNYQGKVLQVALVRAGIPCREADDDTPLLRYVEIRDMLAYLRLCVNPDDRVSFQRVINAPRRGIGPVSLHAFFDWTQNDGLRAGEALRALLDGARPQQLTENRRSLFLGFAKLLFRDWHILAARDQLTRLLDGIREQTDYDRYIDTYNGSTGQKESPKARERKRNIDLFRDQLERAEQEGQSLKQFLETNHLAQTLEDRGTDAVTLSTLHRAKGLQFPVVFVTGLEEGLLPDYRATGDAARLEEERRLLYVGMTRAEDELNLTWAARRRGSSGEFREREVSRFLKELETGNSRQ